MDTYHDASKDPDAIREKIEQTREHLESTVEALAYKTDFSARAKEAIQDKVESLKDVVSGAKEVVTEAFGVAASSARDFSNAAQEQLAHHEGATMAMSQVREIATNVQATTRNLVNAMPSGDEAKEAMNRSVQVMRDNPLGLALGSVALGFLLGSLLPVSTLEQQRIGPLSNDLGDSAKAKAGEMIDQGSAAIAEALHNVVDTSATPSSSSAHPQDNQAKAA